MSQSLYGTTYDNEQIPQVRARWRRKASTVLQLACIALAAVTIGIFIFPVQ